MNENLKQEAQETEVNILYAELNKSMHYYTLVATCNTRDNVLNVKQIDENTFYDQISYLNYLKSLLHFSKVFTYDHATSADANYIFCEKKYKIDMFTDTDEYKQLKQKANAIEFFRDVRGRVDAITADLCIDAAVYFYLNDDVHDFDEIEEEKRDTFNYLFDIIRIYAKLNRLKIDSSNCAVYKISDIEFFYFFK